MEKRYTFEISGTGSNGQTWKTSGALTATFDKVFHEAMRESFGQLTNGRAIFGKPGIGCNGPYDIDRILIEQVRN